MTRGGGVAATFAGNPGHDRTECFRPSASDRLDHKRAEVDAGLSTLRSSVKETSFAGLNGGEHTREGSQVWGGWPKAKSTGDRKVPCLGAPTGSPEGPKHQPVGVKKRRDLADRGQGGDHSPAGREE